MNHIPFSIISNMITILLLIVAIIRVTRDNPQKYWEKYSSFYMKKGFATADKHWVAYFQKQKKIKITFLLSIIMLLVGTIFFYYQHVTNWD